MNLVIDDSGEWGVSGHYESRLSLRTPTSLGRISDGAAVEAGPDDHISRDQAVR